MENELTIMGPEQLRALGHPLRLRVLDVLNEGEALTNHALAARLGVDPGHLHFHVRLLFRAGLIELCQVQGRREKPYRATASTIRVAPELLSSGVARDAQAALVGAVERALRVFSAEGRFRSAQLTARITPDQMRDLVREVTRKAAALENGAAVPLVLTLFSHPPVTGD